MGYAWSMCGVRVLWNRVQYLHVKGGLGVGGGDVFLVGVWLGWFWCVELDPLTNAPKVGYNRD